MGVRVTSLTSSALAAAGVTGVPTVSSILAKMAILRMSLAAMAQVLSFGFKVIFKASGCGAAARAGHQRFGRGRPHLAACRSARREPRPVHHFRHGRFQWYGFATRFAPSPGRFRFAALHFGVSFESQVAPRSQLQNGRVAQHTRKAHRPSINDLHAVFTCIQWAGLADATQRGVGAYHGAKLLNEVIQHQFAGPCVGESHVATHLPRVCIERAARTGRVLACGHAAQPPAAHFGRAARRCVQVHGAESRLALGVALALVYMANIWYGCQCSHNGGAVGTQVAHAAPLVVAICSATSEQAVSKMRTTCPLTACAARSKGFCALVPCLAILRATNQATSRSRVGSTPSAARTQGISASTGGMCGRVPSSINSADGSGLPTVPTTPTGVANASLSMLAAVNPETRGISSRVSRSVSIVASVIAYSNALRVISGACSMPRCNTASPSMDTWMACIQRLLGVS
nr:MAG TPA: hypothetical protein [Caudoviricetes sp.]